jgi:hypothetical protein
MTETKWRDCAKLLEVATGKRFERAQLDGYFALLERFSDNAISAAIQRYVSTSQYPTIPAVGLLVQYASEFERGLSMTPEQAWEIVQQAISRYGYPQPDKARDHVGGVIWETISGLGGWQVVCDTPSSQATTMRAQWREAWLRAANRRETLASLPESIRPRVNGITEAAKLLAVELKGVDDE